MLQVFRETTGKYIAIAILALIAVTFIFFGIDFSITQLSFAAKVDGEAIPIQEFDRQLQNEQQQYQQLYQVEMTDELRLVIRRQVLDRMVMREVLEQRTEDAGYRVSDARISEMIRNDPQFQVGGEFSQDVYVALLTSEGITLAGYEVQRRELGTVLELQDGLMDSSFVTPAEFRRVIELVDERREVAYALFAAEDFLEQVEITDEAVSAYHTENSALFMTEEAVDIEFIELDLASIAETIEISDDELLDYYESEIESYAVSEERRVSHILIEPDGDDYEAAEAEVAAIMARLDAGQDFVELAAELSDDAGTRNLGGDLGWMTPGILEGPFEDALFAMVAGDIEGPVETEFGFHILRLEEIRAGEQQPFEAVRDQLRDELASDRAYSDFFDRANDMANDAYDARDDLAGVAEAYGLELAVIEGLTPMSGAERFVDAAPVIAFAFDDEAIATGENSDLIELTEDRVAVMRVADHHPPTAKPLTEVSEDIRSILSRAAAGDLAAEAATAYQLALEADDSDDALARAETLAPEHGAIWNASEWVTRDTTIVPAAIVSLVFFQPGTSDDAPQVLLTPTANGDQAVVLLTRVEAGVADDIPVVEREQWQQQLRESMAGVEMNAYATESLRLSDVRVPDEILDPEF